MRIRQIKTKTVIRDGVPVIEPELDEHGQEIELSSIEIPRAVELAGPETIEAYAAARPAQREVILQGALAATLPPDPAAPERPAPAPADVVDEDSAE